MCFISVELPDIHVGRLTVSPQLDEDFILSAIIICCLLCVSNRRAYIMLADLSSVFITLMGKIAVDAGSLREVS